MSGSTLPPATAGDLDRVRRITRDLWYWQGLRFVPMGIVGMLAGVTFSSAWPKSIPEGPALLGAFLVAWTGYLAADRYYARTMGHVTPDLSLTRLRAQLEWFAVYPLMVAALVIDAQLAPAIFLTGPVWALALVMYWWSTGRGREHYLAFAAATAALGLLPLVGAQLSGRAAFPIFFVWFGIVYVVAGVLDHLALARALRRPAA
jgi:hypothetical protein